MSQTDPTETPTMDRARTARRAFVRRPALSCLVLVLALFSVPSPEALALTDEQIKAAELSGESVQISNDLRVRIHQGREIVLHVLAREGDDYRSIARRVAGGDDVHDAIAAWNGDLPIAADRWIRVPLDLLSVDYRGLVLHNLFPEDRREGEDLVHVARSGALPTYDEGLWQIAEWFTGDGANFTELMRVNRLSSPEVRRGQAVRIPARLLHASFREELISDDGTLTYGSDDRGPYAGYRLKPGEAVYSAVAVQFTGRTAVGDVGEIVETLKDRSGIVDLRDIPVGYQIKIPLELLEPQFLPAGHPRRIEAEAKAAELARELERQPLPRLGLDGVLVVLDPGHGGRDLGTMNNGIWEHDYVYDVTCRLKLLLESRTAARVLTTMEDVETGCAPSRSDKLKANRQGTILTTPPFLARENGEAKVGVNLRWYLANSIYRKAVADGVDPERIVFMSIHADSRHPSLRGLMVYVPGASYRTKTYGFTSSTYTIYAEVREKPHVRFSRQQRIRSEAVSRGFAETIIDGFNEEKLPVQSYQPIRNRIIRGRQRYVPAVLRANSIPNKVLVEMVNLSNPEDAALLATASDRDRLSRALLRALVSHFGDEVRLAER